MIAISLMILGTIFIFILEELHILRGDVKIISQYLPLALFTGVIICNLYLCLAMRSPERVPLTG